MIFTINSDKIEKKINKKTKAIIPVHLWTPCDLKKIIKIAKKYNLKIVEDCAQAHLTKYNKKDCWKFWRCGTFSFFQEKYGSNGRRGCNYL